MAEAKRLSRNVILGVLLASAIAAVLFYQVEERLPSKGDRITDLDPSDFIDLSGISGLTFIGANTFSRKAGEVRYAHIEGKTLVEIDSTGKGRRDRWIIVENGVFHLVETVPGSNILRISDDVDDDPALQR